MRLLVLILIVLLPREIDPCAATSGRSPTITVTTTTTTAATTLACAGCTLNNPAIEHLQVSDGNKPITSDTVSINATSGCAIRTITCEGNGAGSTVFLSWNMDTHGTTQGEMGQNFVSDTLVCDGTNWILAHDFYGVGTQLEPITSVECTST